MLRNRKWLSAAVGVALSIAISAPAISLVVNRPDAEAHGLGGLMNQHSGAIQSPARDAALNFIEALSARDAAAVWMYASEEEQDAFGTEQAAYEAYAETFPELVDADRVVVQRAWQEGDTPFLEIAVRDRNGTAYRATMGFSLSDAGDWQLVSCEVKPAADRIAGL